MGEIAASAISSAGQLAATGMTNAANAEQAEKAMNFSERMSSTAYQRSTADMKAAGINPMVAFMQGGASTPGGVQATMQTPDIGGAAERVISTGRERERLDALTKQQGAETLLRQNAAKTEQHRAETESHNAKTAAVNAEIAEKTKASQIGIAKAAEKKATYDQSMAGWDAYNKRLKESLDAAGSARRLILP